MGQLRIYLSVVYKKNQIDRRYWCYVMSEKVRTVMFSCTDEKRQICLLNGMASFLTGFKIFDVFIGSFLSRCIYMTSMTVPRACMCK